MEGVHRLAGLPQVHRLDEATGGLLLVAKTRLGLQGLSLSFEQRQVWHLAEKVKSYLVQGWPFLDIWQTAVCTAADLYFQQVQARSE